MNRTTCPNGMVDTCCENYDDCTLRTWVGLTEEEQLNVFAELIAKPRSEYEVYKAYELALKHKNTRGQE